MQQAGGSKTLSTVGASVGDGASVAAGKITVGVEEGCVEVGSQVGLSEIVGKFLGSLSSSLLGQLKA